MPLLESKLRELENSESLDVLMVGDGGREHALLWKLAQSERIGRLAIVGDKAGIDEIAEPIGTSRPPRVLDIAKLAAEDDFNLVVVSSDEWLGRGLVDMLIRRGIPAFGPSRQAATIETDKSFSKQLMIDSGVPTTDFKGFSRPEFAHKFADALVPPFYIKATGLTKGKGAFEISTLDEAHQLIDDLLVEKTLGDAGSTIVIEAYAEGQEVSLHSLADGRTSLPFISSQDHKQLSNGDQGPMTGGMGTIAPVPWFTTQHVATASTQVVDPILAALREQGRSFSGLLYPGIKVHASGLNVIEYNARFGDPEAQVYMRLLKSDLLELMVSSVCGTLHTQTLEWHDGYAACVVMAAANYPNTPQRGDVIRGLDRHGRAKGDAVVFHAGTKFDGGSFYTNGGRVLGVTAVGATLDEALKSAYAETDGIRFAGAQFRTDIGQRPSPFERTN